MDQPTDSPIVLRMSGITKQFPGVKALDSVDLSVNAGEVVALIGENGAGKSTLMKVLGGVHQPDAGTIEVQGERVSIRSVSDADRLGVGFVHQELNVLDNLDVAGNIFLGREPRAFKFLVDRAKAAAEARKEEEGKAAMAAKAREEEESRAAQAAKEREKAEQEAKAEFEERQAKLEQAKRLAEEEAEKLEKMEEERNHRRDSKDYKGSSRRESDSGNRSDRQKYRGTLDADYAQFYRKVDRFVESVGDLHDDDLAQRKHPSYSVMVTPEVSAEQENEQARGEAAVP